MKTIITLIMSLGLLTSTLHTQGKGTPEFLQIEFNDSVSTLEIQNLFTLGFATVEKGISLRNDSCKTVIELKMEKSTLTEKEMENETADQSPDFSKLIFNFI